MSQIARCAIDDTIRRSRDLVIVVEARVSRTTSNVSICEAQGSSAPGCGDARWMVFGMGMEVE